MYSIHETTVEQIKSTPEIREKIIAAARCARKSPSYPAELNAGLSKEQGQILDEYRILSDYIKHDDSNNCVINIDRTTVVADEEKSLWMDSQSHSSSASSDSQDGDCGLGYPTGFVTQFKVGVVFVVI